jgi:redox-sensitive bicupin YhaK (pirin superfamily)
MHQVRKSNERGLANHGWLKSRHTFSFAEYYDPNQMGFHSLRVINEDRIEKGTGFGSHPHRDMEIISYVVSGALEHKDSMGTKAIIRPGEVQRMSAGTGVVHSEHNANSTGDTHFFQIWIQPKERGGAPGYGQKSFETQLSEKPLVLVISQDGRDGSISIKQDADMYLSRLGAEQNAEFALRPKRGAWLQMIKGRIGIDSDKFQAVLETGDAFSFENVASSDALLKIRALEASEFILFDLN